MYECIRYLVTPEMAAATSICTYTNLLSLPLSLLSLFSLYTLTPSLSPQSLPQREVEVMAVVEAEVEKEVVLEERKEGERGVVSRCVCSRE